jgi:Metal-dependent hydrolases of the beta-lactamase superfamily III
VVVLDAGTGISQLGSHLGPETTRVDVLLTHLHMDHILGLGFFGAFFQPDLDVHLWGPSSTSLELEARLTRYLSPPLFPVRLRDLPCRLTVHQVPLGGFELPGLRVTVHPVCHPGPTVGYRMSDDSASLAYIPDHELALGSPDRHHPTSTSGFALAAGVDLLIHDSQYTPDEYSKRVGWGHSALPHTLAFAEMTGVRQLVPFHHDPSHDDDTLDRLFAEARTAGFLPFELIPAVEGATFDLGRTVASARKVSANGRAA